LIFKKGVQFMKKYLRSIVVTTLAMIIAISAAGCANMRGFGKFVPDNNAGATFETFQVNPDYRYYITGSDVYPVAILALDKSYSMGNNLWKELKFTPGSMNEMVTNMQFKLMECCQQMQFGFSVLDPQNKQIGILYSYLGVSIAFRVEGNNIVKMYGPRDDDQLKTYQERAQN
jgi:hypothetical protein